MTSKISGLILFCAFLVFVAACKPTDKTTYNSIVKERDAILSELLKAQEARADAGLCDPQELMAARLALFTFRRDTANSKEEKIKQQELIIGLHEKQIEFIKLQTTTGVATRVTLLEATDRLLQERQLLEELRLGLRKR